MQERTRKWLLDKNKINRQFKFDIIQLNCRTDAQSLALFHFGLFFLFVCLSSFARSIGRRVDTSTRPHWITTQFISHPKMNIVYLVNGPVCLCLPIHLLPNVEIYYTILTFSHTRMLHEHAYVVNASLRPRSHIVLWVCAHICFHVHIHAAGVGWFESNSNAH